MKCQYNATASTAGRRGALRNAVAPRARTPPIKCTPCAPVSKYKNELDGLLDKYTPAAASCFQAIPCPARNAAPSAVEIHHQRRKAAVACSRRAFLAISTVRLDITNTAVLSQKIRGSAVGVQSNETPRRTIKALEKAMNTMVMPIIASQTPVKFVRIAVSSDRPWKESPQPPPDGGDGGRMGGSAINVLDINLLRNRR